MKFLVFLFGVAFGFDRDIKQHLDYIDIEKAPEKVFLVDQMDMFLYKVQIATSVPGENRSDIWNALYDFFASIIESDSYSERSINILSTILKGHNFFKHPSLVPVILDLHAKLFSELDIDLLGLLPPDLFDNQEILRSILNLVSLSVWETADKVIPYRNSVNLDELFRNLTVLSSHFHTLQTQNPHFPISYHPIKILINRLNEGTDVGNLMLLMERFVPIHEAVFASDTLERVDFFVLFGRALDKMSIDWPHVEVILHQCAWEFVNEDFGLEQIFSSALNRLDRINGNPSLTSHQVFMDDKILESEIPDVTIHSIALQAIMNRFPTTEKFEIISAGINEWSKSASPVQILHMVYFCRNSNQLWDASLEELADYLAETFGINLYDLGFSNQRDPWRSEFVYELIARDPRLTINWKKDLSREIAFALMRVRRYSFNSNPTITAVLFSSLVGISLSSSIDPRSEIAAIEEAISPNNVIQQMLFIQLPDDCALHVEEFRDKSNERVESAIALLNSKSVVKMSMEHTKLFGSKLGFIDECEFLVRRFLRISILGDGAIYGKHHRAIQTVLIQMGEALRVSLPHFSDRNTMLQLRDLYWVLNSKYPGSAAFQEAVNSIDAIIRRLS